jgi:NAD(P)-dependent dehydrogenase (short-subunit alcohol dehydrogenase family)
MDLEGAGAIVTGAAVGTGRAIAERLAAEGARVIVADVDERGGAETVARIGGGRARFVRTDMTAAADVEAARGRGERPARARQERGRRRAHPAARPRRDRRNGARSSTST